MQFAQVWLVISKYNTPSRRREKEDGGKEGRSTREEAPLGWGVKN